MSKKRTSAQDDVLVFFGVSVSTWQVLRGGSGAYTAYFCGTGITQTYRLDLIPGIQASARKQENGSSRPLERKQECPRQN
jgi:hypothetical protein